MLVLVPVIAGEDETGGASAERPRVGEREGDIVGDIRLMCLPEREVSLVFFFGIGCSGDCDRFRYCAVEAVAADDEEAEVGLSFSCESGEELLGSSLAGLDEDRFGEAKKSMSISDRAFGDSRLSESRP